jgi:hypothetical protein
MVTYLSNDIRIPVQKALHFFRGLYVFDCDLFNDYWIAEERARLLHSRECLAWGQGKQGIVVWFSAYRREFFFLEGIQTQSGAIQPPTQRIPALFTRGYSIRGVNLTMHLHRMPRLSNIGAMSFLKCVSCVHTENLMFSRDIKSNAGRSKNKTANVRINVTYVGFHVTITAVETQ